MPPLPRETVESFEREAVPHLAEVEAFALFLAQDPNDAADLVQETCWKALRFWDTYQAGTNCRAWLFTICRSQFIRHWRSERRRRDRTREASLIPGGGAGSSRLGGRGLEGGPDADLSFGLLVERLKAALPSIPEPYRAPLRLRLVEGLEYGEIAHRLGLRVGTVKSRIHRGRSALREKMFPA